jgi:hypothetical protein
MAFKRSILILLLAFFAQSARAEVVRIEVSSRTELLGASRSAMRECLRSFREKSISKSIRETAPTRSSRISRKAPKNARGKVEFSSDFYYAQTFRRLAWNGTVLFEVANRGTKGILGFFNLATGNSVDPKTDADLGDAFLLSQGFTLLWVGWQFDAPDRDGLVRAYVPTAKESDGRPIQGMVRSDFTPAQKVSELALTDAAYAVVDSQRPRQCSHRAGLRRRSTPQRIPREKWDFTADRKNIHLNDGFEPHKIYELVYKSQDPPIAGLGAAARPRYDFEIEVRLHAGILFDPGRRETCHRLWNFPKRQIPSNLPLLWIQRRRTSPTKVFDGVMSHVAGGGRGSFRQSVCLAFPYRGPIYQFLLPSGHLSIHRIPSNSTPSPGQRDGLLTHRMKDAFMPKVMYTNSSMNTGDARHRSSRQPSMAKPTRQ